ncbi:MAG: hypothetical protein GX595_13735 [Lentisphaerae bacterium]|nr:hypothetical protein [Lentisphaerota bacterium]
MKVTPCRSYHARVVEHLAVTMADGRSRFKIYAVSIVGRDQPERYEWAHGGMTLPAFAERFSRGADEGVGFVTAFPHITKVFRYHPEAEILMCVRAFNTRDMTPLDLNRGEGYLEFACYAEALLAADEYRYWAEATSVENYLSRWSAVVDAPVVSAGKLRAWWESR